MLFTYDNLSVTLGVFMTYPDTVLNSQPTPSIEKKDVMKGSLSTTTQMRATLGNIIKSVGS